MSCNNSNTQNARRNRNGKVIWFNPPYSQNVKKILVNCSWSLWGNTSPKNNKYHKIFDLNTLKLSYCFTYNIGNIIKQNNSNKVLSKTNDNQKTTTANVIADQNQTVHWMVSVSLNVYYHTKLYLQHPITALFTVELLKGSSKHGITTVKIIQVPWMHFKVLITMYHGKSTKRPHHTNVVRTELISKCRRRNKFLIANVKK